MEYNIKVRILQHLPGVYAKYQPEIGKIYDAEYSPASAENKHRSSEICVIDVLDKRIALRKGEYEIIREE